MSNHLFSQVPRAEIPRSSFDRSHSYKTTMDSGYLIPVYVEEVLPGDTFNVDVNSFCRLTSPLKVPVMDDMFLDFQFFFVPNRLVWDNWEKFNGEQKNPGDSTDYLIPQVVFDTEGKSPVGVAMFSVLNSGSIYDYFGIPLPVLDNGLQPGNQFNYNGLVGNVLSVNALPFRAYNLIWNEWYRDENLQDSVPFPTGDEDTQAIVNDLSKQTFKLLKRGKRHDYFTSALPWPQKGPGVELPLGATAPVTGIAGKPLALVPALASTTASSATYDLFNMNDGQRLAAYGWSGDGQKFGLSLDPEKSGLQVDLSSATAATINSLRQAFQLQRLYERDARGGTRYIEILKAHFGVTSPDARLQRPEYLGGWSQSIQVNPVAQTSESSTSPQGNLSAYALTASSRRGFDKSFVEHGYIIGLASVRAQLSYQQGLNRMWSRRGRFDFYWPVLAHLGEQAILNKEIYFDYRGDEPSRVDGTKNDDVFGYQERWAEYRYAPNKVTGKFRSNIYGGSLDYWHLAQDFASMPKLNAQFIEENPPIDRVVAVPSEPQFLLDLYFKARVARPMPVYSVPGLVDHF